MWNLTGHCYYIWSQTAGMCQVKKTKQLSGHSKTPVKPALINSKWKEQSEGDKILVSSDP